MKRPHTTESINKKLGKKGDTSILKWGRDSPVMSMGI